MRMETMPPTTNLQPIIANPSPSSLSWMTCATQIHMKPKVRITPPAIMNGLKIEDFIPSAVDTVGLTQVDNIMYYRALAAIMLDSDLGARTFPRNSHKSYPGPETTFGLTYL